MKCRALKKRSTRSIDHGDRRSALDAGMKADLSDTVREQLRLDLAVLRRDFSRRNFVVTPANAQAVAISEEFQRSGEPALAVTGPAGSGKTHLLHILAAAAGVPVFASTALPDAACGEPLLAIDDVEKAAAKDILSLVERARAAGRKVALAGRGDPKSWAQGLRDLETRLAAMARVSLEEPDEDLLRAVIVQRFRERQWRAGDGVAEYAAPRIPRTFAAAEAFVDAAGAASIAAGKPITPSLVRKVIENLFEGGSPS